MTACPSCRATVREGDPWCTLCWTDLRPEQVSPEQVSPPAATPARPLARDAADPPIAHAVATDPLTAPLSALLAQPVAADPTAPSTATWPCVECDARSPIEAPACATCGTPFGGRIARLDDARALRQRRMVVVVGSVVAFLALLGAFTLATTGAPPKKTPATTVTVAPQ